MNQHFASYCAAKAGVVALSRCLRGDWLDGGVGVSVICPGFINTGIVRNAKFYARSDDDVEKTRVLLERFGHSPDLVAKACIKAVRKNQELITVGVESSLMYRAIPFLPKSLEQRIARHLKV